MTSIEYSVQCKGSGICSPFLHPKTGLVHYVSSATGEVYELDEEKHKPVVFSGGQPYGAQFDPTGTLHIADCGHAAVLRADQNNTPGIVVKIYEEKPFLGPTSVAFSASGTLYFTDSGSMGETTLENPKGSVFCITENPMGGKILRPIAFECLAHPCGIAVSPDERFIYIAEMMRNRILRFMQRPTGVYHMSVFYQLSGGVGPSCLTCDSVGMLYVGTYEVGGSDEMGVISVISPQGQLVQKISVPGVEITGITSQGDKYLYVTEASSNSLICVGIDHSENA